MNTELRRRGSHDIPIELLHGPVEPEYQEFSNVWESLNDNKRTTNSLLEKLCTIVKRFQTSTTAAVKCFRCTCVNSKSQLVVTKITSSKQVGRRSQPNTIEKTAAVSLWEGWPSERTVGN